jgi:hypothetical protein
VADKIAGEIKIARLQQQWDCFRHILSALEGPYCGKRAAVKLHACDRDPLMWLSLAGRNLFWDDAMSGVVFLHTNRSSERVLGGNVTLA